MIAYLIVGFVVIINNPRAAANRIMFSFSLVAFFWILSILIINIQDNLQTTLFWIRASHALGVVAPWHILVLITSLFDEDPLSCRAVKITLVSSIFMAFVAFSPYFIVGLEEPYSENRIIYGIFTYPFVAYFMGIIAYTLQQVFSRMKCSRGKTRIQMNYLFTGTLIAALLVAAVNVILPLLGIIYVHNIDIRSLGPLFSLIMLGSISYVIIKHRFMDIRLALRKNLTSIITALLLAILSVLIVRVLFQWNTVYDTLTSELIIAYIVFVFVIGLPSIKDRIQLLIDRYLYKGVTDYHTLIIDHTKKLDNMLDMKILIDNLIEKIVSLMKLEYAFYYLKDDNHNYILKGFIGLNQEYSESLIDSTLLKPIIDCIEEDHSMPIQADILKRTGDQTGELLYANMKNMGVDVVLPLVSDDYLEGMLLLGAKDSGEPYYHEDISLLSFISTQVKIGLINAKHYKEISSIRNYQETILAKMGNGLIAVNHKGYITAFNSETEELLGISTKDAVGTKLLETLGDYFYQLFYQTLLKNSGLRQYEIPIYIKGKTQFVSCNTSLIQSRDSLHNEVIIVLSNITRIKELESERRQSQRLITLGEVAAGIAHEIKNPLVSIKTFADLLPEKYEDDEFRYRFSNVVGQEITRINDLVSELLNFVKEPVLNYEQFDITDLIEEIVSLLSPQMEGQGISRIIEFSEAKMLLSADRLLLKQALLNICLNSVQAMPNGGSLIVGALYSDSGLTIYIEDTGPGIADSIRDKIFDPFVTYKADGVGLGLSICHKIISAHGGRIILKGDESTGSRFEIVLPRH